MNSVINSFGDVFEWIADERSGPIGQVYGTCLRSLAYGGQKQLIPVANRLNMQHIIDVHRDAGMMDIGIVFGRVMPMPEKVQLFSRDRFKFGVEFTCVV